MEQRRSNPFNITKALDFTDEEIGNFWVEYPIEGGFSKLIKPTSPMPMIIRGGKGSGKTHLMRHYSFPLQKLRQPVDILNGIKQEGYLGIYMLCGGINASRFSGKGQALELWNDIFAYYMDIWLSQILLQTIVEVYEQYPEELRIVDKKICTEIVDLFDSFEWIYPKTLSKMIERLTHIQKSIDFDVNNSAITKKIRTKIHISPGKLIFGVPKILKKMLPSFKNILFVYLIDEFENLNQEQQKYINSLVRERQLPTTLKIGGRRYAFRTKLTISAGEDIKEGSEFEMLDLDSHFRAKKGYSKFIENLCKQRLIKNTFSKSVEAYSGMSSFFESYSTSKFGENQTNTIKDKYNGKVRPYISSLKKNLQEGHDKHGIEGIRYKTEIDSIIERVSVPNYPLVEKFNIFLLYQDWAQGLSLHKSSIKISRQCKEFIANKDIKNNEYATHFNYWRKDLLIQLFRECEEPIQYVGFDTFIDLSHGLPRNLLVIIKSIYGWSEFYDEKPFQKGKISFNAQRKGVQDASEWFYNDAREATENTKPIRDSIGRLAELFRSCLFTNKPVEVSLAGFSFDPAGISPRAQEIIKLAETWSLLVEITKGEKNRSSERIDNKYVLNKMLSPLWQLPVARRGTIVLTSDEVNSIFDPEYSHLFEDLLRKRLEKMNAPFKKVNKDPTIFDFIK